MNTVHFVPFEPDERALIAEFAGGCTLDEKPGSNWVQAAGGLPEYICRIARAIHRTGTPTGNAIQIAVNRVKVWATGKGVSHKTQAQAAAAVAAWEELRAKSHAKTAAKDAAEKTKAGLTAPAYARPQGPVLVLANSYNLDIVKQAFYDQAQKLITAFCDKHATVDPNDPDGDDDGCPEALYIKEQWNTFLICTDEDGDFYKVPYSVDDAENVNFGPVVLVDQNYLAVPDTELSGADLTDQDLENLMNMAGPCPKSPIDKFLTLSAAPRPTALQRVLALASNGDGGRDYANTKADSYADPGYQPDGKKRYALDTAAQVRAAWNYINQKDNAAKYSSGDLAKVKGNIKAAAKKFGIDISDDAS